MATMIKFERVKKESRKRDRKRERYLLQIGDDKWHLTPDEALNVAHLILHAVMDKKK